MKTDYLATLQAALEANADRVAKPISVDIPNIGKLYVRPRLLGEYDSSLAAVKDGDVNAIASSLARLLCLENGERIPVESRPVFAELLAKQPESVWVTIGNAADGNLEKKGAESGN